MLESLTKLTPACNCRTHYMACMHIHGPMRCSLLQMKL